MAVVESPAALRRPAVERFHCNTKCVHVEQYRFYGHEGRSLVPIKPVLKCTLSVLL